MRIALLVVTLLGGQAALGQAINIDLGHPGEGPSAGYRGAGLPGVWNTIEATDPQIEYALVDIHGNPTAAIVDQFGGTEILESPLDQVGDPAGDDASLLGDALITHTTIESCLFFNGLENGWYEVITYAWMPEQPSIRANVHIDTNPTFTLVGGPWLGQHRERITYARHLVEVTNGFLGPHSGVPSGGDFEIGAALNAIQIQPLRPRPTLYLTPDELAWTATTDAESFDIVRGDLGALLSSGGDFFTATESCLGDDAVPAAFAHTTAPVAGEGFWYLVRGVASDGAQSYDTSGSAQSMPRDSSIDAAPAACS